MKFLFRLLVAVALPFIGACAPAPSRPAAGNPTPLLLVSIDGYRADYFDRGLSPLGREEGAKLARQVAGVTLDLCVTSRFPRAQQTAALALGDRAVPHVVDGDLDDVRIGDLEGRTLADYRAWKDEHGHGTRFPGGESLLEAARRPEWSWFEIVLAYDNARLPEALIRGGEALGRDDMIARGMETLDWIVGRQTSPEGRFRAIGTETFGRPYAEPAAFDQQPLEAQATIDACAAAFAATRDRRWIEEAQRAYRWFLGANDLDLPLASPQDGG